MLKMYMTLMKLANKGLKLYLKVLTFIVTALFNFMSSAFKFFSEALNELYLILQSIFFTLVEIGKVIGPPLLTTIKWLAQAAVWPQTALQKIMCPIIILSLIGVAAHGHLNWLMAFLPNWPDWMVDAYTYLANTRFGEEVGSIYSNIPVKHVFKDIPHNTCDWISGQWETMVAKVKVWWHE